MIKNIFDSIYPSCKNQEEQITLLRSIIEVTEGKMYVEYEYSLAVKKLTDIYLLQNNIEEACKLIQDIQIETFGSLEKIYKVDYILFQLQVLIQRKDFIRMLIVSNKIMRKHLEDKDLQYQKILFYTLMIKYYTHEEDYFNTALCYQIIYDFLKFLHQDEKNIDLKNNLLIETIGNLKIQDVFEKFIYFLNISPPNEKTKETISLTKNKYVKELEEYPVLGRLMTIKTSDDLVSIDDELLRTFTSQIFNDNDDFFVNGKKNASLFRKFLIQHNISIFHKFYNQISLQRISTLLKINIEEAESEVCDMVMNKFLYARINRIKGTVTFRPKQNVESKSDALHDDLFKMLETLEMTCHLIHKENLKYGIKA